MDLKQNAFLRQWISPHQHRKYIHFFTINTLLEHYFFNYKEIVTFYPATKKRGCKSSLLNKNRVRIIYQSPNFAFINSRFKRAILLIEMHLGHSASQARVLVQLPNPSSSILATIDFTRRAASACP